jgi:flavin-dependent dehydrogenase
MMKRKIAKKLNMDMDRIKLWTVKRIQTDNTDQDGEVWDKVKVMEVEEGEIGFWFDDGDGVIVDVD